MSYPIKDLTTVVKFFEFLKDKYQLTDNHNILRWIEDMLEDGDRLRAISTKRYSTIENVTAALEALKREFTS